MDALLRHSEGHIKGILAVAYYTGMRRGEILGLTWDRVDLKNRMIYLEASDTRTKNRGRSLSAPRYWRLSKRCPAGCPRPTRSGTFSPTRASLCMTSARASGWPASWRASTTAG
jgi:integrase